MRLPLEKGRMEILWNLATVCNISKGSILGPTLVFPRGSQEGPTRVFPRGGSVGPILTFPRVRPLGPTWVFPRVSKEGPAWVFPRGVYVGPTPGQRKWTPPIRYWRYYLDSSMHFFRGYTAGNTDLFFFFLGTRMHSFDNPPSTDLILYNPKFTL